MVAAVDDRDPESAAVAQAGAGSGVYNTTRQIGAVLGSAGIAVLMQARIAAELPGRLRGANRRQGALPAALHAGFSAAMAQSLLLPAAVIAVGAIACLFFARPTRTGWGEDTGDDGALGAPAAGSRRRKLAGSRGVG